MATTPLFRAINLTVAEEQRDSCLAVGQRNLLTSIQNEPGTLAMYMGHVDAAGLDNWVVELYRDQSSYEVHAKSPQFAAFRAVAKDAVTDQMVLELTPVLLAEQPTPLRLADGHDQFVQLTTLTLQPDQAAAYQQLVLATLQPAVANEPGLLALNVGRSTADSRQWNVVEIYQDAAAYEHHCQTPAFQQYQRESQAMIQAAQATVLVGDTLVNQGNLAYQRRG
ncbi:antibiotic biosynthesis monooxygenase [Levilactobacillus cerevisiae]|uniref:antibiotic biosynthesis monooxygenase n=1 Tax=Levilactobacillus cerevisiae TaxID=1704076 RepID=UPI000F774026|nr:antibiotic biosynthesis monooxygenase [Levilactobacillus cerevisiae]